MQHHVNTPDPHEKISTTRKKFQPLPKTFQPHQKQFELLPKNLNLPEKKIKIPFPLTENIVTINETTSTSRTKSQPP